MPNSTRFYRKYGMRDNPYFTEPLSKGGKLNIKDAFVQRDGSVEDLEKVIHSITIPNVTVVGEAGVGKTTLVNYVEEENSGDFFTLTNPVEITKEFTGGDVIYRTIKAIFNESEAKGLTEEDMEEEIDRAGGISVNKDEKYPQDRDKLLRILSTLKEDILDSYEKIIVHYDNLENLEDVESIRKLLNELRDFIQDDELVTIFVGDYELAVAARKDERVDSNFATPIRVTSFEKEDISDILDTRYNLLKISDDSPFQKPHNEEVVEILYDLHNGNLRNILRALNTAVSQMSRQDKTSYPIQLDKDRLARTLYKKAYEDYIEELPNTRREVLNVILQKEKATPSDIVDKTGMNPSNVSEYLKDLKKKWGAIKQLEPEQMEEEDLDKRYKYYEVMPEVNWLKLSKYIDNTERLGSQSALGEFTSFERT